jgi:dephospho-CoA kinase
MLNLGLTGGIGSGKSTVARMFADLGGHVLDADELVREMLGPQGDAVVEVAEAFGEGVLRAEGSVDRKKLAQEVFGDEDARRRLEAILHPRVIAARRRRIMEKAPLLGPDAVFLSEAALIFEANTWPEFDAIILVIAPKEMRKARLLAAGWTSEEIERRMSAQWPDDRKAALADWVVDNGGTDAHTRAQVEALWTRFKAMARARDEVHRGPRDPEAGQSGDQVIGVKGGN